MDIDDSLLQIEMLSIRDRLLRRLNGNVLRAAGLLYGVAVRWGLEAGIDPSHMLDTFFAILKDRDDESLK
jgi:hypothetical protein